MKLTLNSDKYMSLALCLFVAYAAMLLPTDAFALSIGGGGSNPIASTLCTVVGWFTGPLGQGIATLAIIIIGIGALMGKVSWGMAIIVGLGVGVIFGASTIVGLLANSSGGQTC